MATTKRGAQHTGRFSPSLPEADIVEDVALVLPDPGIVLVHLRTSLFQNGDPTLTRSTDSEDWRREVRGTRDRETGARGETQTGGGTTAPAAARPPLRAATQSERKAVSK